MSDAAVKLMDADEFLLWRYERPGTWELVDGVPQLKFDNGPEMMAGARKRHGRVAGNLIAALVPRLRGGPCFPFASDLAVRTSSTKVRQPDIVVECAAGGDDDLEATEPTVIFEVLSPSTRSIDLVKKSDEYRKLEAVKHLVLLEPDRARALVWMRGIGGDWTSVTVEGLDAVLDLPAIGVTQPLRELYAGVTLVA